VKLLLSLAQIHLSKPQRDLGEVISILGSIPSLRHKPGVASLLVLLYEHLGDTASAVKVLDQCAASYANQKVTNNIICKAVMASHCRLAATD
jgi:hypothetical protein